MKRAAAAFLLLAACASQQPKVTVPEWSEVPGGVLDAICMRLHDEGVSQQQTLNLVTTTQPLMTGRSMNALADAMVYSGRIDMNLAAEAASEGSQSLPVRAGKSGCSWRAISAAERRRENDTLAVEVSAPFVNPFGRNSVGLLARLSLGGESPMWYWVPLVHRGETWAAGMPMPLATRD